ncbi:MAG: uridine kinase [Bacteroidota bacterium]
MNRPTVVGISGGSGSGKTRFMKELKRSLSEPAALHSMDNYYLDLDQQPVDQKGVENFDTLDSLDIDRYISDLKKLIAGHDLEITEYTFNNEKAKAKKLIIPSSSVILVEGIFVLAVAEIRALLDIKLFVEAPDHLMVSRRIIRDAEERGYDLHDVIYRYQYHVAPSFKKYTEPSREHADLIIPNYTDFDVALKVVKKYLSV